MQWSLFYWMDASPAFFHGVYAVALASAVGMLWGGTRLCGAYLCLCYFVDHPGAVGNQ